MIDIMLDIETKGKKAGCAILSVGAVAFNRQTGDIVDQFYMNLDTDFQEMLGFHVDEDTMNWWSQQSEEAWNQTQVHKQPVTDCLSSLNEFFNRNKCDKMWSQGSAFDAPILEHAFNFFGVEVPWRFWNVRDTRTAYEVMGFNPKSVTREGTYHNALDDSIHQVKCLIMALKGSSE